MGEERERRSVLVGRFLLFLYSRPATRIDNNLLLDEGDEEEHYALRPRLGGRVPTVSLLSKDRRTRTQGVSTPSVFRREAQERSILQILK